MADVNFTARVAEAQWLLHCAPQDAAAAAVSLGAALGTVMLRATASDGWQVLHLAPDEWLLIGPAGQSPERSPPVPHALVDVSERSLGLKISGADAAAAIGACCPLDLVEAAFPVGMCTRTVFGKVAVVLWRTGPDAWRLDHARSFENYVMGLLALAVADADD